MDEKDVMKALIGAIDYAERTDAEEVPIMYLRRNGVLDVFVGSDVEKFSISVRKWVEE